MALFDKDSESSQVASSHSESDVSYLNQFAGDGMDQIVKEMLSASYLTITQDLSDPVKSGTCPKGVWYNTATQTNLGNSVDIIVLQASLVWDEKGPDGIRTVARYEPNTVEVKFKPVPPGKTGRPRMINAVSENPILETIACALVLPEHPEFGVVFYTAGSGSLSRIKQFISALKSVRLPNGDSAPIYAKSWRWEIEQKQSKAVPGMTYFGVGKTTMKEWTSRDFLKQVVLPMRENIGAQLLLSVDETDSE